MHETFNDPNQHPRESPLSTKSTSYGRQRKSAVRGKSIGNNETPAMGGTSHSGFVIVKKTLGPAASGHEADLSTMNSGILKKTFVSRRHDALWKKEYFIRSPSPVNISATLAEVEDKPKKLTTLSTERVKTTTLPTSHKKTTYSEADRSLEVSHLKYRHHLLRSKRNANREQIELNQSKEYQKSYQRVQAKFARKNEEIANYQFRDVSAVSPVDASLSMIEGTPGRKRKVSESKLMNHLASIINEKPTEANNPPPSNAIFVERSMSPQKCNFVLRKTHCVQWMRKHRMDGKLSPQAFEDESQTDKTDNLLSTAESFNVVAQAEKTSKKIQDVIRKHQQERSRSYNPARSFYV
eukprot:TRINITY_DN2491_c0_g2_i2.p1 TRINITY_DN2491_c0_g2~~TRINITY_DN2491_c0_g2_i2.p1  ORF type:complete len:352 (+),score=20.37 TRINITY_DN2491_c0_g2_i2:391-1446(+)